MRFVVDVFFSAALKAIFPFIFIHFTLLAFLRSGENEKNKNNLLHKKSLDAHSGSLHALLKQRKKMRNMRGDKYTR